MSNRPWYKRLLGSNPEAVKRAEYISSLENKYGELQALVQERIDLSGIAPGSAAVDTSLPSMLQMANSLQGELGTLTPLLDPRFSDVLFTLSISSPLISQTIFDDYTLANSGHSIRLEGGSDSQLEQAASLITELACRMHEGGADGWFNVALYQLLVSGALSHEWVVLDDLSGLDRSKFVPTKSIRFRLSGKNDGRHVAFQKADAKKIELDPLTYHYRALIRYENNPYGIPPFFAAIEPEFILRDMRGSIRGVAHKLGLLGLFQILIKKPIRQREKGETEDAYKKRLENALDVAQKQLEKSFKDGILLGFENEHDFEHKPVTGDARGMGDIYDRMDLDANSGAKTDPALHGRNFSRTETQIRQIYSKLVRQLMSIRGIPSRSLEEGYALHLALAGFNGIKVSVDWNPIDSLDEFRDKQVEEKKIQNERGLYEDGITSQDQRAARLGFETPDQDEPRETRGAQSTGNASDSDEESESARAGTVEFRWSNGKYNRFTPVVKKKTSVEIFSRSREVVPLWPYAHSSECDCGCDHAGNDSLRVDQFARLDPIDQLIEDYVRGINKQVTIAGDETMAVVREFLRIGATQTQPERFAETLYQVMSDDFVERMGSDFVRDLVETHAPLIYRESLLGAGFELTMGAVAGDFTPVFDPIIDSTTVDFLEESDLFYMGKFVKRDDTADRIQKKIIDDYIAVGRDFSDKKFVNEVAEALALEYHQAERIIRATSNMSRNFGSLRVMEQSQVVRVFEIFGPDDRLKCPWCRSMLGRTFKLSKGVFRMRNIIAGGSENLPNTAPILVSSIPLTQPEDENADPFIDLTDDEIQAQGFDTPPYHPRCRDRIAAVV